MTEWRVTWREQGKRGTKEYYGPAVEVRLYAQNLRSQAALRKQYQRVPTHIQVQSRVVTPWKTVKAGSK